MINRFIYSSKDAGMLEVEHTQAKGKNIIKYSEKPVACVGLGTMLKLASGAMITKDEAGYVDHPVDGQRCGGCTMFKSPDECALVEGDIAPNGYCRFWDDASVEKNSDHPGGLDLHARPENAVPIEGIPVADVVTRANVQHVSWEMVRENKYDPKPATLSLADIIATQEIVDRQRVLRHMIDLREEGVVEPKAPPLVILWDGDYFLLGGHHGVQAAYNLGFKEIGVMLMVAPT